MKTLCTTVAISAILSLTQIHAADTPAVQTPAAQTPAVQTPAVQTPAIQKPAAQTPVTQVPSTPETQAIYRSVSRQVLVGNDQTTSLNTRGFLILDPDGLRATTITAFTLNGVKLYTVQPLSNYRIFTVTGSAGLSYTVLAKAETSDATSSGPLVQISYSRGLDTPVTIDSQGPRMLPRSLPFSGATITANNDGVPVTAETSGNFTLDVRASRSSSSSESFDAAVARLSGYLAALGYTQTMPSAGQ